MVGAKQFRPLLLRHFMYGEASFEHVVYSQIIKCFLFLNLSQHSVDNSVVLHPQNFYLSIRGGSIQTLAQVANNLVTLVNYLKPRPGAGRRQLEDTA